MTSSEKQYDAWKNVRMLIILVMGAILGMICVAAQSEVEPQLKRVVEIDLNARPKNVPTDYVTTPNGFFSPECVRHLHSDDRLQPDGSVKAQNGTVFPAVICSKPHYRSDGTRVESNENSLPPPSGVTGWFLSSSYGSQTNIGGLTATWVVPAAPINQASGQTIYLFPALEQRSFTSILQPVLGWTSGSSPVWTISSWNCCVAGTTMHSDLMQVNAGDIIRGTILCNTPNVCDTYDITTADLTSNVSTTLSGTSANGGLQWVFGGVLEGYNIASCDQFPSTPITTFSVRVADAGLQPIVPPANWSSTYYSNANNLNCVYNVLGATPLGSYTAIVNLTY